MRLLSPFGKRALGLLAVGSLPLSAIAADILTSSGFTNCQSDAQLRVEKADIKFDRSTGSVVFDVAGTSDESQNVKATIVVTAYGNPIFTKDFDPCDAPKVDQLCPVPKGNFAAKGTQEIPKEFLDKIPSIAFSIPDLDGDATIKLTRASDGKEIGCVQSGVTNGKTMEVPAVSYIGYGIAGAALILSGVSAAGSAGSVGSHASSLGFMTVVSWFQSMAMNGMMSVNYPPVYRSFAKNFGFSTGLIEWDGLQRSIDKFRGSTGGNLTNANVDYLRNATIVFTNGESNTTTFGKRSLLFARDFTTSVNGTQDPSQQSDLQRTAYGIGAYAEKLSIPETNTFMTVLLVFAIVIAAITVGILLFKVILEAWALFGKFPNRLTGFRKRYWRTLAKTITNLILLLYGVWTLYCIFQFTHGDSWAAKVLAAVTLATFTAILGFFTFRIWHVAHKYKKAEGDTSALYENKETWIKYSIFYDSYKKGYWWLFMPVIVYMFAKGCVLAAGNGHGLIQTAGQLIIESLMFILLLWSRPYATTGGNWLHIIIQIIRVLSVVCILVFVEQLGIAQTTKTITGVVLIVVQAALTGILALLIAINAIITCCKENPHRKRRKEAEKLNREFDNLTPLDPRNSLLTGTATEKRQPSVLGYPSPYTGRQSYTPVPTSAPTFDNRGRGSPEPLINAGADMGHGRAGSGGIAQPYDPVPYPSRYHQGPYGDSRV